MIIMVILLGITVSFMRIWGKENVTRATRMLVDKLYFCRQSAISGQKRVGLLLPSKDNLVMNPTFQNTYGGMSMRLCFTPGNSTDFEEYMDAHHWEFFPGEVNINIGTGGTDISQVNLPEDSSPDTFTIQSILFEPDGTIHGSTDAEIMLTGIGNKTVIMAWLTGKITIAQ